MFRKKLKRFVSNIDLFLLEFDRTHSKSEAQLAEIQKYNRIYALRDKAVAANIHEDEFFS